MYENFTLDELRKICRERGILNGTKLLTLPKSEIIYLLENSQIPEKTANVPETGKNDDLSQIIADAIKDKLNISPRLNEERIIQLIKENSSKKEIVLTNFENSITKNIGVQHEKFEVILKLAQMRKNILLVGASGSGKTQCAENIAIALDLPFFPQSVGQQTTKSDLLGYMNAGGEYVPSHLYSAYKNGGVFLLDEIDSGNSNVLTVLNSALANGYCSFPNEVVKKHENFICIAAANTFGRGADRLYVGRNQLDAATLKRFAAVNFDYDESLEKQLSTNSKYFSRFLSLRESVSYLKERIIVSTRDLLNIENCIANGFTIEEAEEMFIFQGISEDTKNRILENL